MLIAILTRTPFWVWGLLIALLTLGLAQTRSRRVTRGRLLALPLSMLALGLWTMSPGFVAQPLAGLLWLLAMAGAATLGLRMAPRPGTQWLAGEQRLQLPGSWLPLVLIMAIFVLRYAMGVALALNPAWRTAPQLMLPAAMLFGAISGMLLGRALGLLQITRRSQVMAQDTIAADVAAPSRALV